MPGVWSGGGFLWVTVLFSDWCCKALPGVRAEVGLLVFPSDKFTSPGAHSDTSGGLPACCCSVSKSVQLFVTPWTAARQASPSFSISWCLLKLTSVESVMPSSHLILCCPLLLLPSIFLKIRVFSSKSVLRTTWPNYWHFSFSISPSNEYSRLISSRMDWLDLLAVQGTLKSLLQHHTSKAPKN